MARFAASVVLVALWAGGCSSGSGGSSGSGSSQLDVVSISNGFGLMIPHQVFRPDAQGNPTQELVAIRSNQDLFQNVTATNPILAPTEWPTATLLPNGDGGNHFVVIEFSSELDVSSILDATPSGQANSGLTGTISILALDPATGQSVPVSGRAFVGGRTYGGNATGSPPQLELQQWVTTENGRPVANTIDGALPGLGFPGTESASGFNGSGKLTQNNVFVFVPDDDGNLASHDMFPANRQIKIRVSTAVRSVDGRFLLRRALGSSTVGQDLISPEVATTPPPTSVPVTTPSFSDSNVDPLTTITMEFTEPIQPLSLGTFPSDLPPPMSTAVNIRFGPDAQTVNVPFTVEPISAYDLTTWELVPAFNFPGAGPDVLSCGTFNRVTVDVNPNNLGDYYGNMNSLPAQTFFDTGAGPGLVNAPVLPDAIYATRLGATPGVSVIDLNGFGQSTGNPEFDFTYSTFPEGNSNFPNNPNLIVQGSLIRPPIAPGTCTVDGGSAGVFTLTKDSALNDLLLSSPLITSVGDMAIGWALDVVFNNGQEPTGCQAGGGNICAIRGRKQVQVLITGAGGPGANPGSIPGNTPNQTPTGVSPIIAGGPNPVSWGPHPNPPALVFPPLCTSPFIGGNEPTSYEVVQLPCPNLFCGPNALARSNLLTPGDPFGEDPENGQGPSGLLTAQQNGWFEGPSPIRLPENCVDYMMRQQVGHFLYLVDRARRELVVVNSNRFTILDRIPLSDPTDLAVGPNIDLLAVSNQTSNTVSFIDIDPTSSTFHQIIKETTVGQGPRGVAWDPGNEDILVCNESESTMSIISAFSLDVRRTVSSQLNQPFDVCILQRQLDFGYLRDVYFAFILNRGGRTAVFESGPNGVNGWGFDDIIGAPPLQFDNPKKIAIDPANLFGGFWVLHENPLNQDGTQTGTPGGAATLVVIDSSATFPQPLTQNATPGFRDMQLRVRVSIGPDVLTGIPVDMAFDDLVNHGGLINKLSVRGAGTSRGINGKSGVRGGQFGVTTIPAKFPGYLLLAVPNSSEGPGVVDVINLQSGFARLDTSAHRDGLNSVPVPGVSGLCDYWRQ